MKQFKPIYIYAQSLDNSSDDLMYQITHANKAVLTQIGDLSQSQQIIGDMNAVISHKTLKKHIVDIITNTIISKIGGEYIKNSKDCLIYHKDNQIVINVRTNETDNLGRRSFIQLLLDTSNLTQADQDGYFDYFYEGFMQFCKETGRTPQKNIDFINIIKQLIFSDLTTIRDKIQSKKGVDLPKISIYIIAICIALLVVLIIKSCNS
ncbi:hypothetical protein ACFBZI_02690 [Moraxella sp. ZJ142]|uniref:hypothetical protein n=1 Tax=Moraxella marmotae TaxID=3344520 RepID=UPI0035D4C0E7